MKTTKESLSLNIEDIDEVEFDEFFEQIHQHLEEDENSASVAPADRIEARKWAIASLRMKDEIEFLDKKYKTHLQEKYLEPVDKKIRKMQESIAFVEEGLLKFLKSSGEKRVSFPDIGTVSKVKSKKKIIYPEDENSFAENLRSSGDEDFVNMKYTINKKAISKYLKDKGELPVSGLATEKTPESIRITRAKNKDEQEKVS